MLELWFFVPMIQIGCQISCASDQTSLRDRPKQRSANLDSWFFFRGEGDENLIVDKTWHENAVVADFCGETSWMAPAAARQRQSREFMYTS
jgi:hypothetical protein